MLFFMYFMTGVGYLMKCDEMNMVNVIDAITWPMVVGGFIYDKVKNV